MSLRKEFEQVQKLIVKLSNREFDQLQGAGDDTEALPAFIENLVMLGEELNETTVSKEYFQDIFNSVPDIVLITNARGQILTANTAMDKLRGILQADYTNEGFNDYFSFSDNRNAFASLKKDITANAVKMNVRLGLRSNDSKVYQCNFGRLQSEQKSVKYLALIKDITELDGFQQQVKESAQKFRQIFDKTSDGILLIDKKGFITEMNDAAKSLFVPGGLNGGQLNVKNVIRIDGRIRPDLITMACTGKNLENMEVAVYADDGKITDCLLSTTPMFEKKKLTGHQAVIKNISLYKEYNLKLLQSIEESQERERKRIATDLHDSIGQQLSGIKFMLNSLIAVTDKETDQKGFLNQMNMDIFRVLDELRQICFDLMPRSLEKFGLVKTLEEHFEKIRRVKQKININFNHPKAIPAIAGKLELSIYRIIQEVVNNSLKYSKCSQIDISLVFEKRKLLKIMLKDNGIGFNPALPKNQEGMGMSNIRSRVRAFKGTMEINSKKDTGTIFKIEIPLNYHDYHH
jgi:PAS domain S-box-containing protein